MSNQTMSHFFSCDWGTSSFRLRRVDVNTGQVLKEQLEHLGVRALYDASRTGDKLKREKAFANYVRAQLLSMAGGNTDSLNCAEVIVSGMASSSIGWRELPYATVPVGLDGSSLVRDSFELDVAENCPVRIHLISGVRTESDVMRGEEVEILGLFHDGRHVRIAENGIVVLPGTHSKHVRLRQRQIVDFRTYMTGELFDVLSAHSLLRSSVEKTPGVAVSDLSDPASHNAFAQGVERASVSGLMGNLFQTRVRTVLQNVPTPVNRWFLSGLLIGSEVVDFAALASDTLILLAAAEPLSAAYRSAFEILGFGKRLSVVSAEEMPLAAVHGHRALLSRCSNQVRELSTG